MQALRMDNFKPVQEDFTMCKTNVVDLPHSTEVVHLPPSTEVDLPPSTKVVHLPPLTIEIKINKETGFSIILENPISGIYQVILVYHDSNGVMTQFYQFEMMDLLKDNVKIDVDGPIITFFFESYATDINFYIGDDVSNHFSYSFSFSNFSQSEFVLGNELESMPILLPLNGIIYHIWSKFFYYLIPRPKNCCEIYVVQSSDSSAKEMSKRMFKESDIVIQKIICDFGSPSIRRDPATGHFFVASDSDDPKKPISIDKLTESNHLIHLPVPNGIELLQNRTLVLSDLSIKFDSELNLIQMMHLSNNLYLLQRQFHPTIREICIVRSSPPDYWRPQRTPKYFSNGDVIVKKIYMKTPNPLDVLKCSDCILLVTSGNDELYGYQGYAYRLFLYTLEDLK
jgi:hypothetical protein